MDADELLNKQVQHMEKERREREARLKAQEKKVCLKPSLIRCVADVLLFIVNYFIG